MSWSVFLPQLAVMAIVTYLIRMLPLALFRKKISSRFVRSFLYYVPYAVLSAMTLPSMLYSAGSIPSAAAALIVALALACRKLAAEGVLSEDPIRHFVTGVSAGIVGETPMLDLQYSEDSRAQVDLNCVMNENGEIIELQGTGEGRAFTPAEQQELVRLCAKGNRELLKIQKEALGGTL